MAQMMAYRTGVRMRAHDVSLAWSDRDDQERRSLLRQSFAARTGQDALVVAHASGENACCWPNMDVGLPATLALVLLMAQGRGKVVN
jgi:hypothetical protein